ncbi:putative quinol monooxygenase [Streptomyces sp. JJ36]|uniref:putative quinol monooxygenase n=1 Tax=Streptomyces sp. JJ36 TaxID=2736645 RepID=UPI001F22801B|nr:antibiotic biosynthesis monooxygenase [Streptomyces sp. JJ36]MCF6524265.1 antibiotic biosynthesis monooxygenase [Streptomyces sp. JJ36]
MSIFVRARFDVPRQQRPRFEELLRVLCAQARQEPGTLTYRWFFAGEGGYVVLEEYADTAAAVTHNERAADLLRQVGACAEMTQAEIYGTPGPEILDWAHRHPRVTTYPDLHTPDPAT